MKQVTFSGNSRLSRALALSTESQQLDQVAHDQVDRQSKEYLEAEQELQLANRLAFLISMTVSSRRAEEMADQADDTVLALEQLKELAETCNESGGMSMESIALFFHSVITFSKQLKQELTYSDESIEQSLAGARQGKQTVSLESLMTLETAARLGATQLRDKAYYAQDQTIQALALTMDALEELLKTVHDMLQGPNRKPDEKIDVSDGLGAALSVNGKVPEDLGRCFKTYCDLGIALVGPYAATALEGVLQFNGIAEKLNFESAEAYGESLTAAIQPIKNPIHCLSETQQGLVLFSGISLFKTGDNHYGGDNAAWKQMNDVSGAYIINDVGMNYFKPAHPIATGEDGIVAPIEPYGTEELRSIAENLLKVIAAYRQVNFDARSRALRADVLAAIQNCEHRFQDAPGAIADVVAPVHEQLVKYIDRYFDLVDRPLLQYLVNFAVSAKRFVELTNRHLKLLPKEAEAEAVAGSTAPVSTDIEFTA